MLRILIILSILFFWVTLIRNAWIFTKGLHISLKLHFTFLFNNSEISLGYITIYDFIIYIENSNLFESLFRFCLCNLKHVLGHKEFRWTSLLLIPLFLVHLLKLQNFVRLLKLWFLKVRLELFFAVFFLELPVIFRWQYRLTKFYVRSWEYFFTFLRC